MYVIFPLDELLDLNSARRNKRGRLPIDQTSHTRVTAEEVLPLSQPNQLLPNQLKPPLNKQQPKANPSQTTVTKPQQQQKAPPTPPQKQPPSTPTQKQPIPPKSTLSKASSKTSISVTSTPPSIVVPSQTPPSPPASVIESNPQGLNVRKPSVQLQTPVVITPQVPDQVTKRQRSSHSTSTETSSTSSTGAKGKALLSPQPSGGPATNRSSWGGSTAAVVGAFQESSPARSGSFKAYKDISVSTDGNTLKVAELSKAESVQDITTGNSPRSRPPLIKNNSFRSHLSDSCALRPRPAGTELLKKPPPPSKQPSPTSDSPKKKTPEISEQQSSSIQVNPAQGIKTAEAVTTFPQGHKERQPSVTEGIRVKQEVPLQASPPGGVVSQQQQLTAAESLRIQQECLPPVPQDSKGTNQRHPSGKSSNRGSGSQRLSDLPPSGGIRGATAGSGSANSKSEGVSGSPRGLQQPHKNMASHEASFRDLTNPTHNETLKAHNAFTFKLVKTGPSSGPLEESQSLDETTSSHLHESGPPGHLLPHQHPTS